MNEMLKGAKGMAKNPLGIIALFISLIYGFASLVMSAAGAHLNAPERLPLVWFLVLFPVLILFSFLYLVTRHHRKLYAPSDYKDEKHFMETIDLLAQREVLNESSDVKDAATHTEYNHQTEKSQRMRTFLIVENLILRKLEKQYNHPIRRQVRFSSSKKTFDGIIELPGKVVAVEVKYLDTIAPDYVVPTVLHYRRRLHSFQRVVRQFYTNQQYGYELVVVTRKKESQLEGQFKKLMRKEQGLHLKIMLLSELEEAFGLA